MKLYKSILTVILLLSPILANSQKIINTIEKDLDGRYMDKDGFIKSSYKNTKIVDINSVLEIKLDREELLRKIGESYKKKLPENLSKKLNKLTAAMEKRNIILSSVAKAVESYDYDLFKTDRDAYTQYVRDLQPQAKLLTDILEIDKRIENQYISKFGQKNIYEGVYMAAAEVIIEMNSEIEKFAQENGVNIQFGGWLHRKNGMMPIHLSGFDDIAPQEAYEVERWRFIPSDDQISDLQKLQKLAQDNKNEGISILKATATNQIEAIKSFGFLKLNQLLDTVQFEIKRVKTEAVEILNPDLLTLIDEMTSLESDIRTFLKNFKLRFEYYTNILSIKEFELKTILEHAKTDIEFITVGEGKRLLDSMAQISERFKKIPPAILNTAGQIDSLFTNLRLQYTQEIKSIEASGKQNIENIIYGERLDIAALEFGKDVYSLSLSSIPGSTELDLSFTGVRSKGDRLAFKLTVISKDNITPVILDSKEIYMFKVLPHVEGSVGVIFANPFATTNVSTQFQMAPYYNLLFKGLTDQKIRRRSIVYNRLLEYGWGLHVSSPDFNKDDVPELGVGVVVSVLNDYVQSGIAVNVFDGNFYWFFGLKLPFQSFNFDSPGLANSGETLQ